MLPVTFLTLLRALEVNIDLRHVNHIRYYYYYYASYIIISNSAHYLLQQQYPNYFKHHNPFKHNYQSTITPK